MQTKQPANILQKQETQISIHPNKSFKSEADNHVVYHYIYQCNENSCYVVDYNYVFVG